MFVIHPKDKTTAMLSLLYEGQEARVINGYCSTKEMGHLLHHVSSQERIMMLGHGNANGLFYREDDTKDELQRVLDEFGAGIQIVRVKLQKADPPREVVDAFNEVQRAKADMERFKNEAEAYRNEVLPKAHGKAAQILQDAEAYKATMINKAQGEADRFASVYAAYKSGKEVTVKKMYLEAMEDVLQKSNKVIVDQSQKGNLLPILQLNNPQPQTKD